MFNDIKEGDKIYTSINGMERVVNIYSDGFKTHLGLYIDFDGCLILDYRGTTSLKQVAYKNEKKFKENICLKA